MSPHFNLILGKKGRWVLSPKDQRDLADFHQRQMQKQTSITVWECISANGMGDWDMCEGTIDIYWDCTETYTAIKITSFMGSPWLLAQDNTGSHFACAITAWFCRHMWMWLDVSRSVSYWKYMAHHEKENQTTMTMDCWAAEVLYQARLGKTFACKTLKISIHNSQMIKMCN